MEDKSKMLRDGAERIGVLLLNKFKVELEEQGHILDGNLRDSLEMVIENRVGGFSLAFMGLAYGVELNDGVVNSEIPTKGSARFRELLVDMAKYASKRFGVSGGLSYRIASNIIAKWRVEGKPTRNSYRFSRNGRRKGWIDYVLENSDKEIEEIVGEVLTIALIDIVEEDMMEFSNQ